MTRTFVPVTITCLVSAAALVVACSSTSQGTASAGCTNDYSGRWKLSGSCSSATCEVGQTACNLTVRCDDGTQGTGSVNGASATVSGLLGAGDSGSCSLAFDGSKGFSMQCTSTRLPQPCSGSGACEEGSCGKPIATGAGGTLACRQKAGADTDEDCVAQTGKPRKLDCDSGSQTELAVAAGCTPTKPGDSDVCCPLTVKGTPDGGSSGSSGTSGSSGSGPPVSCLSMPPNLFAPVAGTAAYCAGAATATSSHCPAGQSCCQDRVNPAVPTARQCAATCPAAKATVACYSAAECPGGQSCCGMGTADATSCSYLTVRDFTGTVCSTTCRADEYVACSSSAECSGGRVCTAAYVMNQAGTATVNMQVGVCQ